MSAAILAAVVRGNLALAAAVLLILALRRPVRQRFGPSAAYALWLIAPACLLAALLPVQAPETVAAPAITLLKAGAQGLAPMVEQAPDLTPLIIATWMGGVLAAAALFARRQAQFVRTLGRLSPLESDPGILRGEHVGGAPMLLGALAARIVVPADFETRFTGVAHFGQASLRLADHFQMKPASLDGKPTAGVKVTIPINFQAAPSCPPASNLLKGAPHGAPPAPRLPPHDKQS